MSNKPPNNRDFLQNNTNSLAFLFPRKGEMSRPLGNNLILCKRRIDGNYGATRYMVPRHMGASKVRVRKMVFDEDGRGKRRTYVEDRAS